MKNKEYKQIIIRFTPEEFELLDFLFKKFLSTSKEISISRSQYIKNVLLRIVDPMEK